MRLTTKITCVLVAIILLQCSVYGFLAIRRQKGFLARDMKEDALQIGQTLATAVSWVWKTDSPDRAFALVRNANWAEAHIKIRFVWLEPGSDSAFAPELPLQELDALKRGRFVVKHGLGEEQGGYVYSYVRIPIDDPRGAALELRESLDPESAYATASLVRITIFSFVLIVSAAVIMWILGVFLVARPIRKLQQRAQQIARGEFAGHLEIHGNDEIALLGQELNRMSDQLLSARTRIEEETAARVDAVKQLRHADRLTTIGTLASGLAHELGTPLNVVSGRVSMIESSAPKSADLTLHTQIVLQQIDKMAAIIRQLLDFSRTRSPEKAPRNLDVVMRRVVEVLEPFAERRGIALRYLGDDAPALALVDESQMEQVFTNLIVNAIQCMEGGEIIAGITPQHTTPPSVTTARRELYHRISIRDFGPGILPEELNRIFDPFFTTKPVGKGTGMGLSIAHGIVEEHRGWIDVTSQPGKGSCFEVYIPAGDVA